MVNSAGLNDKHKITDSSWDMLMPVVEKINLDKRADAQVLKNACIILHKDRHANIAIEADSTKQATYAAVVEFIKWYNSNTPKFYGKCLKRLEIEQAQLRKIKKIFDEHQQPKKTVD